MRKIFNTMLVAVAISALSLAPKAAVAQDDPNAPITLQTFYDQLSPYGQWVNYPPYGDVFIPNAGPGFIPYSTSGHWEYTDQFGWTWASDYPWGWACFHYGRWNYDASYGWFWIPDTQWGPAWVVWRNSDQYYGWAPLPWGVDINVGINDGYGIPDYNWCFVPAQYMGDPNIYNYYMPRGNNRIFITHSAVIIRMDYDHDHRYGFFAGPDRRDVERYHHGPIQPVVVNFSSDPHHVRGPHEMAIYRPAPVVVRHDAPAQPRVVRQEDVPRRNVVAPPSRYVAPARVVTPAHNPPPPNRGGGNSGRGNSGNGGGHHR